MSAKITILEVMTKEGTPLNAGGIAELSGLDRKEVDKALKALKDEKTYAEQLPLTVSQIDKLAKRGSIHKNKASNLKSKLSRKKVAA